MKILLSYSRPHFDPDKPEAEHEFWGSSANILARTLHSILSRHGEVTYINPDEYSAVAGRSFDLFVGQYRHFQDILRVCQIKRSVFFAVNMHPAERNRLIKRFIQDNHLNAPEVVTGELVDQREIGDAINRADQVIGVGNMATYNSYVLHGVPKTKVRMINYAVGPAESTPGGSSRGPRRYLYLATEIGLRKGFDILEKLADDLAAGPADFKLDIVGTAMKPVYQQRLAALAQRYSAAVKVHGWLDVGSSRFTEILRRSDFLLFPTLEEGQAGTVLDALRLGVVPITTDRAGIDFSPLGWLEAEVDSGANRQIMAAAQALSASDLKALRSRALEYYTEYHGSFEQQLAEALDDAIAGHGYPRLSITLAIFNKQHTILGLLERLHAASRRYGNVELHLILDGCKDRTEEIVRGFYARHHDYPVHFYVTPNIFEVESNNLGLRHSTGRYCVIIQDDNYINDPNCFLEAVAYLERNRTAVILGGLAGVNFYPRGTTGLSGPGQITMNEDEVYWRQDEQTDPQLKERVFQVDACMRGPLFIRKSFLEEHGYLDEVYAPLYDDDMDLAFRAHKYGYKVYSMLMDVENRSETVAAYDPKRAKFWADIIKKNSAIFYKRWTPSTTKDYSWVQRIEIATLPGEIRAAQAASALRFGRKLPGKVKRRLGRLLRQAVRPRR